MHIHRPKENVTEKLPEQGKSPVEWYGIRGKVVAKADDTVYARREDLGDSYIHFALAYRHQLYNPYGDIRQRDYVWKAVSKSVFDLYVNFLKTQRESYLNTAEREYANG